MGTPTVEPGRVSRGAEEAAGGAGGEAPCVLAMTSKHTKFSAKPYTQCHFLCCSEVELQIYLKSSQPWPARVHALLTSVCKIAGELQSNLTALRRHLAAERSGARHRLPKPTPSDRYSSLFREEVF